MLFHLLPLQISDLSSNENVDFIRKMWTLLSISSDMQHTVVFGEICHIFYWLFKVGTHQLRFSVSWYYRQTMKIILKNNNIIRSLWAPFYTEYNLLLGYNFIILNIENFNVQHCNTLQLLFISILVPFLELYLWPKGSKYNSSLHC